MKKILSSSEMKVLNDFNNEWGLNVDWTKGFYFILGDTEMEDDSIYIVAKDFYDKEGCVFDQEISEVLEIVAPEILDHFSEVAESAFESLDDLSRKKIKKLLISLGLEEIKEIN